MRRSRIGIGRLVGILALGVVACQPTAPPLASTATVYEPASSWRSSSTCTAECEIATRWIGSSHRARTESTAPKSDVTDRPTREGRSMPHCS